MEQKRYHLFLYPWLQGADHLNLVASHWAHLSTCTLPEQGNLGKPRETSVCSHGTSQPRWSMEMLFVTDCQSPFTFSTLILLSSNISTFRAMQSLHVTWQGEWGQHHLSNLCYANSLHTRAQDLFIPIPAWIMPDLKQSILQTAAEWAGSMTYWGSSCPLMVTETESPVWSMPQSWSETPMLAWEKTRGLQAQAICVGVLTPHICPMVQRNMSWDVTLSSSCRAESVSLEATTHSDMSQPHEDANLPIL